MIINKLLRKFNMKLIRSKKTLEWAGDIYQLPLKSSTSFVGIEDANGKLFPLAFSFAEDRDLVLSAINQTFA